MGSLQISLRASTAAQSSAETAGGAPNACPKRGYVPQPKVGAEPTLGTPRSRIRPTPMGLCPTKSVSQPAGFRRAGLTWTSIT